MEISRYGIILNVENFQKCVDFYKNLFSLPVLRSKDEGDFKLTCLSMGDTYLMIETGGEAKSQEKNISENPSKLRFNVKNIEDALAVVKDFGVEAEITDNSWGKTINIVDPDGNRVGIREEQSFL